MHISEKLSRFLQGTVLTLAFGTLIFGLVRVEFAHAHVEGEWVEFGRCEVNYMEGWPQWAQDEVNNLLKWHEEWEVTHEDAYITLYADVSKEEKISTTYRVFSQS